jgi:hypothetical protein
VDVGQHTTAGDGHGAQQLAQLLVVPDCQLEVTGDDAVKLLLLSSVNLPC